MQDRSNTPSPAPQSTTQIDARRTVSDSTAAPATATTSTAAYRFPAPARSLQGENHTYTYGSSSTSTSARAASPKSTVVGSGERSDFGSLVANPSSSLSATGSSSSVSAALPSFGAHDGGYSAIQPAINGRSYAGSGNPAASARQRQQPPYHRSHTADEIHTASPFELSSDGTLTRPNAPFTSHSAKPSRTHLANLPKSLIPGGYDFSPTSTSAHESPPYPRHHQTSAPASAFAFARDRSASVPRTVSSTEDDSSRSSIDQTREGSRMPTLHEVDATFVTAKHTLESASLRTNRGDDSGHAQFISAFSNSSHPASSRQSTEEENASMLSHDAVAPLISPIPPKLDLDFGNSSGFSLDFGGDFGGSLGLTFGSGAGGGSAAYQRGDFGESRLASKAPHSPAIATTIGPTKQGGEAELETRDTKSTMASFLSLQDSTLSSQDDDSNFLFLADSAVEGPPMSANSDCTLQSLQRQNRADISAKAKPVDQQQQVTSNAKRIPEADPASRKGLLISSPEMTIPASTTNQQASQPIAAIRSESPASFISMSSVSRPLSSLSTGNPSISDFSLARKRLLDNSAYKQEYASSDDSKRTTLSSGEQVQFKTSQNSSVANLPNQGAQHNANVRASFNKSLPPVPPKSPSQARTIPTYAAEANASQPSTLKKASQLHSANSQDSIGLGLPRDFSGTARRSYSEHGQSYNEHRPALSYVRHNSDYTAAPGERRTSSLNTVERPSSQASGADNASLRSTTSSAYASLDNTRTFSAPNVPDVTRAYRPSRDSEEDVCHGRSETARPRANTVDHFQGIKNAFDKDGISLQDATVAKLARPKTNVRNAWPGGELRKRDAVTDRVLVSEKSKEDEIDVGLIQDVQETVSAKLAMWLSRHPERLMTAEEAELHNSLSLLDATNTKEARLPNELQSSATTHPAAQSLADSSLETSSLQSTQDVNKRRPPGASLVDEAKAAPATARLLESKSADATSNTAPLQTRRLPQNDDHVSQYPVPGSSTLMQTNQSHLSPLNTVPSSLPALTTSSSLTVTTGSDSLASTCKNSEPIRTPLTAVASSPSLDPAFASTVPLKILPKNRSGNLARTAKPLSPGGEQPWTQAWTDIGENLIR